MSHIPPVRSQGFTAPIEPVRPNDPKDKVSLSVLTPPSPGGSLTFQASLLPKTSASEILKEANKLNETSMAVSQELTNAEKAFGRLEALKKGATAILSIALLPAHHIDMAQDNLIDPLSLLKGSGIEVGETLETIDAHLLNIELVLRGLQGVSEGVILIVRHQYLSESKRFLELLRLKSMELRPGSNEIIQLDAYLKALDEKIKKEEIFFERAMKDYAISNAGYLPTAVGTVWNLCSKMSPVAGTALGWVGGVVSSGIYFYEKNKAAQSIVVHEKFFGDIQKLAEKHAKALPPKTDDVTFAKRKELKDKLKELTLTKHQKVDDYLHFSLFKKSARFYVASFLTAAYLALQTAAIFVAIGSFILFPQFALLGLFVGFLAVGIYYWASNRPNLFRELILTSMKSMYYTIGNALDSWQLQRSKMRLLKHTASHIDLMASQLRDGKKVSVEQIAKFTNDHNAIKKSVETLETLVKYWTTKKHEVHTRLMDAELADMNRATSHKTLNVKTIVGQIKSVYSFLTEHDKTELKDVVGLDLKNLGKEPSTTQIQERLLTSYLGMDEDDLIKSLKTKKAFHNRYPLG